MNIGRPAKYTSPEELQAAIDNYFQSTDLLTVTGLAMALGFCDRQSLFDYEKRPEFSCIIKAARLTVENCYEAALYGRNCAGPIFALKQMGWKDKVEQEITGSGGAALQIIIKQDDGCKPID